MRRQSGAARLKAAFSREGLSVGRLWLARVDALQRNRFMFKGSLFTECRARLKGDLSPRGVAMSLRSKLLLLFFSCAFVGPCVLMLVAGW